MTNEQLKTQLTNFKTSLDAMQAQGAKQADIFKVVDGLPAKLATMGVTLQQAPIVVAFIQSYKDAFTRFAQTQLDDATRETKGQVAIKKVVKDLGNFFGEAIFAPLLPFKGMMKNHLIEWGEYNSDVPDKIREITIAFAKHLGSHPEKMSSGSNFEMRKSSMQDGLYLDEAEPDVKPADFLAAATTAVTGNPAELVKLVLRYLKQLGSKKASGQTLTPIEEKILANSQQVTEKLKAAAKAAAEETVAGKVKDFIFSWKGGTVGGIILLYIIYRIAR